MSWTYQSTFQFYNFFLIMNINTLMIEFCIYLIFKINYIQTIKRILKCQNIMWNEVYGFTLGFDETYLLRIIHVSS